MPPSKLVPNLKYGGSGVAAISYPALGNQTQKQTSKDAVFGIDWPIEERLFVSNDGAIAFKTLAWHYDLIDHGIIGAAGKLQDWWDYAPTQDPIYVNDPHMAPRFYKDGYGQWWKQTSPCKFTECDDGRGAWCCRNTMKDWPLRHEADRDKEFAVCSKLNLTDKTCNLHNEAQGKPLQCVMSPLPGDMMFYIKGGKCTVRWTPVEGPDE